MPIQKMSDDGRIISTITFLNTEDFLTVESDNNHSKITKIKPYYENSQIWFAIFRGAILIERVNGAYIKEVYYKTNEN